MILIGIINWANFDFIISKKAKQNIGEHKIKHFQKASVLPFFLLGILFIAMGVIEEMNVFETPIFLTIYIALSIIPLGIMLINKKKYLGSYWSK